MRAVSQVLRPRWEAMSTSIERVKRALHASGLDPDIRHFPAGTRTAEDAARAIGVAVGQIVKSLVFVTASEETVLVLASGANRVDETLVAELLGEPIARPDADHVRAVTGFAIGGVPPVGHEPPLRTIVDEDFWAYGEVWAAAGTPRDVFAITPDRLLEATAGQRAAIKAGR